MIKVAWHIQFTEIIKYIKKEIKKIIERVLNYEIALGNQ